MASRKRLASWSVALSQEQLAQEEAEDEQLAAERQVDELQDQIAEVEAEREGLESQLAAVGAEREARAAEARRTSAQLQQARAAESTAVASARTSRGQGTQCRPRSAQNSGAALSGVWGVPRTRKPMCEANPRYLLLEKRSERSVPGRGAAARS